MLFFIAPFECVMFILLVKPAVPVANDPAKDDDNLGLIVGGAVGGVIVLAVIIIIVVILMRRKKSKHACPLISLNEFFKPRMNMAWICFTRVD